MKSNNFTQALRELTGFDSSPEVSKEASFSFDNNAARSPITPDFDTNAEYTASFNLDKLVPEKDIDFSGAEVTTITETMIINGDIRSEDNLLIDGQVYGNITTAANLTSSNLIIGDLKAQNVLLDGCRVKGNVNVDGHINITQKAIVVGDVNSDSIKVSGKIKGNLDIASSIVLKDKALISGNIIADDIASEPGSRINGTISTHSASFELDAEFDFGGEF